MLQEQQPRRVDKIDLRVHACLYFIRPTGHTLKPLDIEVMKRLSSRVNLIPVVAKADTLTPADLVRFKRRIRDVVEAQGIQIYRPPSDEDDEAAAHHARALIDAMPFAVIGSEKDVKTQDGRVLKGRQYSWGVAEVENEDHCDFKKLRSILIRTHMLDLIHTTEEIHYETYRAQQMETRKFGEARPRKLDNPKFKEEEESLRKRFTEQVKVEENRFRSWEQKLISERDRLNKDLESTHAAYVSSTMTFGIETDYFAVSNNWRWSWSQCKVASSEATGAVAKWDRSFFAGRRRQKRLLCCTPSEAATRKCLQTSDSVRSVVSFNRAPGSSFSGFTRHLFLCVACSLICPQNTGALNTFHII